MKFYQAWNASRLFFGQMNDPMMVDGVALGSICLLFCFLILMTGFKAQSLLSLFDLEKFSLAI